MKYNWLHDPFKVQNIYFYTALKFKSLNTRTHARIHIMLEGNTSRKFEMIDFNVTFSILCKICLDFYITMLPFLLWRLLYTIVVKFILILSFLHEVGSEHCQTVHVAWIRRRIFLNGSNKKYSFPLSKWSFNFLDMLVIAWPVLLISHRFPFI